ncbi:hypothetical protein GXW82_16635 [Streptacidiphilus sp. 4-A2]|nr:hypothetical protein [Streptacidiphilus sp. 4-A2]
MAAAADVLASALSLWRADPLADEVHGLAVRSRLHGLQETRLQALEGRIEAELRLGRHRELVVELRAMADAHPLREALHGQLMLALSRSGRQAEALDAFMTLRSTLVEELGVEPSAPLQELHRLLLTGDVAPPAPAPPPAAAPAASAPPAAPPVRPGAGAPRPAQLPRSVGDLVGREEQLEALAAELTAVDRFATPVVAVIGMGGLGKTALVVRAGHRVAPAYPDGALYLDLRGADADFLDVDTALHRLLLGLGADPAAVPGDTETRSALLRSLAAQGRYLFVLDNARDAAQVRPLLPGSAGCAALVTSRNRLAGLEAAHRVELDVLHRADSHLLLSRIAGTDRVAREPEAAAELVDLCAGLPLALRIVGSRLASRPSWTVRELADRLVHRSRLLDDELAVDDLAARACFETSYATLVDDESGIELGAARAFQLLGLWPGPEIALPAAAALFGVPVRQAESELERLVDMNLIQSAEHRRYHMHDLIRVYSAERAALGLRPEERRAALERPSSGACTRRTPPPRSSPLPVPLPAGPADGPVPPPEFGSPQQALEWCDAERSGLVAVVQQASAAGLDRPAWLLGTLLMAYFEQRMLWSEMITTHLAARTSAGRIGDADGAARALMGLASAYRRSGDFGRRCPPPGRASAYRELGDERRRGGDGHPGADPPGARRAGHRRRAAPEHPRGAPRPG